MFRNRSAVEIIVIAFTATVCVTILLSAVAIVVIEATHPETDTSGAAHSLLNIISGIIGAMLGLLAGKVESGSSVLSRKPDGEL